LQDWQTHNSGKIFKNIIFFHTVNNGSGYSYKDEDGNWSKQTVTGENLPLPIVLSIIGNVIQTNDLRL